MSLSFSRSSNFTKLVILVEFMLVAYLIYSLTKNVYNSYQVDQLIDVFHQENDLYEEENRQKSEDFLYFSSEEYIDKIAKQNLDKVNPGEEVIVLAPEVLNHRADESEEFTDFAVDAELPNWKKWVNLFFER